MLQLTELRPLRKSDHLFVLFEDLRLHVSFRSRQLRVLLDQVSMQILLVHFERPLSFEILPTHFANIRSRCNPTLTWN